MNIKSLVKNKTDNSILPTELYNVFYKASIQNESCKQLHHLIKNTFKICIKYQYVIKIYTCLCFKCANFPNQTRKSYFNPGVLREKANVSNSLYSFRTEVAN